MTDRVVEALVNALDGVNPFDSAYLADGHAYAEIEHVVDALAIAGYLIVPKAWISSNPADWSRQRLNWHPSFFEGHEDDGHGGCIRCRFYVPRTDDEHTIVPFPCPFVLFAPK